MGVDKLRKVRAVILFSERTLFRKLGAFSFFSLMRAMGVAASRWLCVGVARPGVRSSRRNPTPLCSKTSPGERTSAIRPRHMGKMGNSEVGRTTATPPALARRRSQCRDIKKGGRCGPSLSPFLQQRRRTRPLAEEEAKRPFHSTRHSTIGPRVRKARHLYIYIHGCINELPSYTY